MFWSVDSNFFRFTIKQEENTAKRMEFDNTMKKVISMINWWEIRVFMALCFALISIKDIIQAGPSSREGIGEEHPIVFPIKVKVRRNGRKWDAPVTYWYPAVLAPSVPVVYHLKRLNLMDESNSRCKMIWIKGFQIWKHIHADQKGFLLFFAEPRFVCCIFYKSD